MWKRVCLSGREVESIIYWVVVHSDWVVHFMASCYRRDISSRQVSDLPSLWGNGDVKMLKLIARIRLWAQLRKINALLDEYDSIYAHHRQLAEECYGIEWPMDSDSKRRSEEILQEVHEREEVVRELEGVVCE
jgi:hypothetical protein